MRSYRSALVCRFGEGAQLFGVDVPQLLQLSLSSPVQILDVHHIRLLDVSVLSELVADPGDEARFVLTGPQELPVQSQDLLLQFTVPRHQNFTRLQTWDQLSREDKMDTCSVFSCSTVTVLKFFWRQISDQTLKVTLNPECVMMSKLQI